jgi:protein-L-isoaspartate(D-aspartate) O-methyltransferase
MNTEIARRQMVDQQVRAWEVVDARVLALLADLEREDFVPEKYRHLAYAETEIPLGHGQRMMAPVYEGRVLQALELSREDSVLEIGTGSGFLTACLASLGTKVLSIDIYDEFLGSASDRLSKAGINNVELAHMDASRDLPTGTFDAIAVTASLPRLDQRLLNALNPGGRLFVVVGDAPAMDARLVRRDSSSALEETSLFETNLAPLVNLPISSPFLF